MKKYFSLLLLFAFVSLFAINEIKAQPTKPSLWQKVTTKLRGQELESYSQAGGALRGFKIDSILAQTLEIYPTAVANVLTANNALDMRGKFVRTTDSITYYVDFYGRSFKLTNSLNAFATKTALTDTAAALRNRISNIYNQVNSVSFDSVARVGDYQDFEEFSNFGLHTSGASGYKTGIGFSAESASMPAPRIFATNSVMRTSIDAFPNSAIISWFNTSNNTYSNFVANSAGVTITANGGGLNSTELIVAPNSVRIGGIDVATIQNATPTSTTIGTIGQMRFDNNFLYICTSVVSGVPMWKKVPLSNL